MLELILVILLIVVAHRILFPPQIIKEPASPKMDPPAAAADNTLERRIDSFINELKTPDTNDEMDMKMKYTFGPSCIMAMGQNDLLMGVGRRLIADPEYIPNILQRIKNQPNPNVQKSMMFSLIVVAWDEATCMRILSEPGIAELLAEEIQSDQMPFMALVLLSQVCYHEEVIKKVYETPVIQDALQARKSTDHGRHQVAFVYQCTSIDRLTSHDLMGMVGLMRMEREGGFKVDLHHFAIPLVGMLLKNPASGEEMRLLKAPDELVEIALGLIYRRRCLSWGDRSALCWIYFFMGGFVYDGYYPDRFDEFYDQGKARFLFWREEEPSVFKSLEAARARML